ncbi:MAG: putative peptidyl-prolyl cis-trans isomerase [bacterium ADurb.Bin400]|nr:MAG: putative peptidyl-prolyl cis-trans isomerase [bacterium ADurb.Bin400]
MGKKSQIRRQKSEEEKKAKVLERERLRVQTHPWYRFWRRADFWIYVVSFVALVAYPFVSPNLPGARGGKTGQEAIISTSKGDIKIELYKKDAPKTVDNFIKLAESGFYDDLTWHRVIKDFMIQGGDPSGDGTGGPGYTFEDEINQHKIVAGTVAMANSGPNTNGSQFFIVTERPQPHLDGKHTAFGAVKEGMDVVRAIAAVPVGEDDKPLEPVYISRVEIK